MKYAGDNFAFKSQKTLSRTSILLINHFFFNFSASNYSFIQHQNEHTKKKSETLKNDDEEGETRANLLPFGSALVINPGPGTFGRHRGSQNLTRRKTYLFRGAKRKKTVKSRGDNRRQCMAKREKRCEEGKEPYLIAREFEERKSLEFASDEGNRGREEKSVVGGEEEKRGCKECSYGKT